MRYTGLSGINSNAISKGTLKPPQIIEIHCQSQIAPMHCAVRIPNVPAKRKKLSSRCLNHDKPFIYQFNQTYFTSNIYPFFENLPIAGITASLPLRFGVEISIVYTVATVVDTPKPFPNKFNIIGIT